MHRLAFIAYLPEANAIAANEFLAAIALWSAAHALSCARCSKICACALMCKEFITASAPSSDCCSHTKVCLARAWARYRAERSRYDALVIALKAIFLVCSQSLLFFFFCSTTIKLSWKIRANLVGFFRWLLLSCIQSFSCSVHIAIFKNVYIMPDVALTANVKLMCSRYIIM